MEWNEIIVSIATIAIPAILAWVGTQINAYFKSKQQEDIVKKVVGFVEQTCNAMSSTEKYQEAFTRASEWLTSKGLEISETELQMLIESSVQALNKGLKGEISKKEEEIPKEKDVE